MCDICDMTHCPPACPCYEGDFEGGGAAVGECALCEGVLHAGERVLARGGKMLCLSCAEDCDLEALLYLEGAECPSDLLYDHLGWESRYV